MSGMHHRAGADTAYGQYTTSTRESQEERFLNQDN